LRRHPNCRVSQLPASAGSGAPRTSFDGRPPGAAVFGVFGGLTPNKRLPSVLHAFAEVHGEFPESRLVVAGRNEFVEVEREVERLVGAPGLRGGGRGVVALPP